MNTPERVVVVGASGALGQEIIRVLDRAPWRPTSLVAAARVTTSMATVAYGEQHVPIDDVRDVDFDVCDLAFFATPAEVTAELAAPVLELGVPIVDCSGALAAHADFPMVVPWVNPEALLEGPMLGASLPGPAALLLGSIVGPLARAGLIGDLSATVMVPASVSGRDGVEELSNQVVALLNSQTPRRRVFEQGLAFDLDPLVGRLSDGGWSDTEEQAVAQLTSLVPQFGNATVSLIRVPLFSGVSADFMLRSERRFLPELVERVLSDGGVKLPEQPGSRYLPRPRRVEGRPFAHVGRVRTSGGGQNVHLFASMDNLRTGATAAVAAGGALINRQ